MYLHLGNAVLVKTDEVIGIFDLDNTTVSKKTRDYLNLAEKNKEVITVSYDLPKSFVVCAKNKKKQKVYLSQLSTATLQKRSGYIG
ncbi:MAG: DUF370 domain-containing protein [Clostridia bacterium]|nr:DUF370 domain-containing protein [Clostridia bacterium]